LTALSYHFQVLSTQECNKRILLYVALTRSSKQIIITYTGLTSEEYSCSIDVSTYDGRIYRGSEKNYNTKINEEIMKILKKIHKGGSDHLFG